MLKEVISELQCWRTCNFHNTGGHGAVRIVAQDSQPRITGIGVEGGLEGKPRGKVWMQQGATVVQCNKVGALFHLRESMGIRLVQVLLMPRGRPFSKCSLI